jgi:hypothetical protein
LDYRIPKQNPDWYPKYNPWLKEGFDCCAPDSVSFHYSPAQVRSSVRLLVVLFFLFVLGHCAHASPPTTHHRTPHHPLVQTTRQLYNYLYNCHDKHVPAV